MTKLFMDKYQGKGRKIYTYISVWLQCLIFGVNYCEVSTLIFLLNPFFYDYFLFKAMISCRKIAETSQRVQVYITRVMDALGEFR